MEQRGFLLRFYLESKMNVKDGSFISLKLGEKVNYSAKKQCCRHVYKHRLDYLSERIDGCINFADLYSVINHKSKDFSKIHWFKFFARLDDFFYRKLITHHPSQDITVLCLLKKICQVKRFLTIKEWSKVYFLYGILQEKRVIQGYQKLEGSIFENFLVSQIEFNLGQLDELDIFRISKGLLHSQGSESVCHVANRIFEMLENESVSTIPLIRMIAVFNKLSYDYIFKLWPKIDFSQLSKFELLEFLRGTKKLLMKNSTYHEGFNLETLFNALLAANLSDYEFACSFKLACKLFYDDPQWKRKALELLMKPSLEEDVTEKLCAALNRLLEWPFFP